MTKQPALYPTRTKLPVKIFDLKAFVQAKKDEKINEMMKGMGENSDFPPLFDMPDMPKKSPKPSLNVDDLVKKIDAKIAELEEEERLEKEKSKENKIIEEEKTVEKNKDAIVEQKSNSNTNIKENITDDQFFDDN